MSSVTYKFQQCDKWKYLTHAPKKTVVVFIRRGAMCCGSVREAHGVAVRVAFNESIFTTKHLEVDLLSI